MGFIDETFLLHPFRSDSRGRLVFTSRFPRRGAYIVPPDRAAAFQRFARFYFLAFVIALPFAGAFLFGDTVLALIWLAGFSIRIWSFTSDLEPASEIPPRIGNAAAGKVGMRGYLTFGIIVIAYLAAFPLLFQLPRAPRVLLAATVCGVLLWFAFRGSRGNRS